MLSEDPKQFGACLKLTCPCPYSAQQENVMRENKFKITCYFFIQRLLCLLGSMNVIWEAKKVLDRANTWMADHSEITMYIYTTSGALEKLLHS